MQRVHQSALKKNAPRKHASIKSQIKSHTDQFRHRNRPARLAVPQEAGRQSCSPDRPASYLRSLSTFLVPCGTHLWRCSGGGATCSSLRVFRASPGQHGTGSMGIAPDAGCAVDDSQPLLAQVWGRVRATAAHRLHRSPAGCAGCRKLIDAGSHCCRRRRRRTFSRATARTARALALASTSFFGPHPCSATRSWCT